MLSEKKAINSLKPWWDVAFHYSLMALLTLGNLIQHLFVAYNCSFVIFKPC